MTKLARGVERRPEGLVRSMGLVFATKKRTHDLDLTILADIETTEAALHAAGLVRDPKVEHRWLAQGVRLDVLPATSRATAPELEALWPAAAVSGIPLINLPGAPVSQVDAVNTS